MTSAYSVEERPFRLELEGNPVLEGTCSPDALEALAAGRLLADGMLAGRHVTGVDVAELDGAFLLRAHAGPVGSQPSASAPGARPEPPPHETLHALFRELFRAGDERHPHGGVHVVALSGEERLVHIQTDIGRHNAVDKVIGEAFLAGTDMRMLGLVLSARVSGEIARKAVAADVAWIATRSLPTTLAVATATRAGIPIVARAASREAYVWTAS